VLYPRMIELDVRKQAGPRATNRKSVDFLLGNGCSTSEAGG
jgi:hypothetical protein